MAWIMHSSGPWKDHKYKERKGEPGNYTYVYTGDGKDGESGNRNYKKLYNEGSRESAKSTITQSRKVVQNMRSDLEKASKNKLFGWKNFYKKYGDGETFTDLEYGAMNAGNAARNTVRNSYKNERTGYKANNKGLVGGEEAEKARTKRNARRKDFEKMTLTSMRNALNSAKENKKKSDADMRDAAVARGREQYMTNRAKKTVGAMTKAIEKKREEEKRKAYSHSRLNRIMGR